MPRIPIYQGGQVDLPAAIPYGRMPYGGASGLTSAAQGLAVTAQSISGVAEDIYRQQAAAERAQQRVADALKKEETALDLARLSSTFEVDYTNYETELMDTPEVGPDRWAEHMREWARQRMETDRDRLRHPDAYQQYLTKIEPVVAKSIINTDALARRRRLAVIEGDADLANRADAMAAVIGPPQQRGARLQSVMDRIDHLTQIGVYSGEQRGAKRAGVFKMIQEGEVTRDFDNPQIATSVIDQLYAGKYQHIGGLDEQRSFANKLMDRRYMLEERDKKEREEAAKKAQGQVYADLADRAWDGTLTREEYDRAARQLEPSQRNHLRELMAREPNSKEAASDVAVRDRVMVATQTRNPTMRQADLDRLRSAFLQGAPGLNYQDWKEATAALRRQQDQAIDDGKYGHSVAGQRQSEAEQQLQMRLGIPPGPIPAGVDATTLRILGQARFELKNRSNYFSGREDPLAVADEIVSRPGYMNAIGYNAERKADELSGGLPAGQTPEKLDAQYRNDRNNPEYKRQFDIYMKLLEADRQKRIADQEAAAAANRPAPAPSIWQRYFGGGSKPAPSQLAPTTPAPPSAGQTGRRKRRTGPAD